MGLTLIVTLLLSLASLHAPQPDKPVIEYKDFVSILLTGITIVLAVLAAGIALLAVWGFKEFETRVNAETARVAGKQVDAYLNSAPFNRRLDALVEARGREQVLAKASAADSGGNSNDGTPIPPAP